MSRFQSVSLPTLSDTSGMREVENEARKMGLDILQKLNTVDAELTADIATVQENVDTVQANVDALDTAISTAFGTVVSGSRLSASSLALVSGTTTDITSITLTAGSWDISGAISLIPATTTSVGLSVYAIGPTSATLPGGGGGELPNSATGSARIRPQIVVPTVYNTTQHQTALMPTYRATLTATTTLYLMVDIAFTVSTLSAYGWIQARKVY
jgi:hypothetical protein